MSHLRELGAVRHHVLVPVFPCSAWMLQGTGWKDPRGDTAEKWLGHAIKTCSDNPRPENV